MDLVAAVRETERQTAAVVSDPAKAVEQLKNKDFSLIVGIGNAATVSRQARAKMLKLNVHMILKSFAQDKTLSRDIRVSCVRAIANYCSDTSEAGAVPRNAMTTPELLDALVDIGAQDPFEFGILTLLSNLADNENKIPVIARHRVFTDIVVKAFVPNAPDRSLAVASACIYGLGFENEGRLAIQTYFTDDNYRGLLRAFALAKAGQVDLDKFEEKLVYIVQNMTVYVRGHVKMAQAAVAKVLSFQIIPELMNYYDQSVILGMMCNICHLNEEEFIPQMITKWTFQSIKAVASSTDSEALDCARTLLEVLTSFNIVKYKSTLLECGIQEVINKLLKNPYAIAWATVLKDKMDVATGKAKTVARKCHAAGCMKRDESFKKCGGCKSVSYCSRECQRADWADHKAECKRRQESGTKISRSEEAIERTVALNWIHRHYVEIMTSATSKGLGMGDVVFEVDLTGLEPKLTHYLMSDFYTKIVPEVEYLRIQVKELQRLTTKRKGDDFVIIAREPHHVGVFLVPVSELRSNVAAITDSLLKALFSKHSISDDV